MEQIERNYKGLNLKREAIDIYATTFVQANSLVIRNIEMIGNGNIKRITIGRPGIEDALLDLHLVKDGTTTINFKVGRNQELGKHLADHIYETIDPGEFLNVNLALKGITSEDIDPILSELETSIDEKEVEEFTFEVIKDNEISKIIHIISNQHQDSLTLSHYKTTNRLTLQGRPLFTYRKIIYLLSELLDLSGLQSVLVRQNDDVAEIVSKDIAIDYLRQRFNAVYDQLPDLVRDLLVTGTCVKLAKPKLPDYSMLLFPDLRSLEGVLKVTLSRYELYTDQEDNGFGAFFELKSGKAFFKEDFRSHITCGESMIIALETAYTFFRKHRHSLFHMKDFADASRRIDTLDKALALSDDSYVHIRNMFENRKK